jgi:hypothetical protein
MKTHIPYALVIDEDIAIPLNLNHPEKSLEHRCLASSCSTHNPYSNAMPDHKGYILQGVDIISYRLVLLFIS